MAQRIPIQLHVANALQWLGTLYRNPADALKEHVSNAIDEHLKAKLEGAAHDRCDVVFTLDRHQVTIEYPYGMSRLELESALRRVADSAKRYGNLLEPRQVERIMEQVRTAPDKEATAAAALVGSLNLPNANLVPLILEKK